MANENVIYVDPDLIQFDRDEGVIEENSNKPVHNFAPDLSNYCIAIDLSVEVKERGSGNAAKRILLNWSCDKGDKSFFSGRNMSFNGSKNVNYLTTNPSEFGTFEDIIDEGTSECFGINSINVMYNNYMVPEITIEFTDIRGVSLFAPEELRHKAVNENGMNGCIDRDVAGSFFKCFFTFPYPVFKIMIKGFYGEPTSYELSCSDFRARFDCNTGNFGATAKFVGYSYSLLNDVTMNALCVAPYAKYGGEQFWTDRVNSGKYTLNDGTLVQTFAQLIEKSKQLKRNMMSSELTSSSSEEISEKGKESDLLSEMINSFKNYYKFISGDINEKYVSNLAVIQHTFIIMKFSDEKIEEYTYEKNQQAKMAYDTFIQKLDEYKSNSLTNGRTFLLKKMIINDDAFMSNQETIDYLNSNPEASQLVDAYGQTKGKKIQQIAVFDYEKINKELIDAKTESDVRVSQLDETIKKETRNISVDTVGISPTVKNLTTTLMAHFETLIHCIYKCAKAVKDKNRTPDSLGISKNSTDIIIDNYLPPFPKVEIKKNENGIDLIEDGWIGELNGGKGMEEPEAQLIESLLEATKQCSALINSSILDFTEKNDFPTLMRIPLNIMDILVDSHPFGTKMEDSNFSDLVGRLILRAFSVYYSSRAGDNENISNDFNTFGKLDSVNFLDKYPFLSDTFTKLLCDVNDVENSIILTALGDDKSKQINNEWPWDINDKNEGIIKKDSSGINYHLNLFKDKNGVEYLPIQGIEWGDIKNDLKNNTDKLFSNGNCHYITSKCVDSVKTNDKIFRIEKNGHKYSSVLNNMTKENMAVPHATEYGIELSQDSLGQFFYPIDGKYIGPKLKSYDGWDDSFLIEPKYNGILPKTYSNEHIIYYDNDYNTIPSSHFDFLKLCKKNDQTGLYPFKTDLNNVSGLTTSEVTARMFLLGNETTSVCLFGCYDYYNNIGISPLLVLEALHYRHINLSNVIKQLSVQEPYMAEVPYISVLLLGGYLYYRKNSGNDWKNKNTSRLKDGMISLMISTHINDSYTGLVLNDNFKSLYNCRKEIINELINEFDKWQNSEFKKIKNAFELKIKNDVSYNNHVNVEVRSSSNSKLTKIMSDLGYYIRKMKISSGKLNDKCTELLSTFENNLFENYQAITYYSHNNTPSDNEITCIGLLNREDTYSSNYINKLINKLVTIINPINQKAEELEKNGFVMKGDLIKSYLSGFVEGIKQNKKSTVSDGMNEVERANSDYNIRVSLYKYMKLLWDRWLSGTKEEYWYLESFYDENWYFIDSFYNKIGDSCVIDLLKFTSNVVLSQRETNYSMLSFISKAYAEAQFNFYCVQNFIDLAKNDNVTKSKMKNLFTPIPYKDIDFDSINSHPSFIILYTNEYSSKLNIDNTINGTRYYGDSFDISADDENLPIQISSKTPESGYKIPAFGVTYGKQYQSYFKNIDVSMDTPMITEQSIQAQFMIASPQKENDDGSDVITLGQDLYTIYSNNSYTCTVTMMGCAWIQPLMYFQLNNVPLFRGAYLIQKVNHKITPGNMETTFTGVRMANVSTKKCNTWYFSSHDNGNGEDGRGYITKEDREAKIASISNNCPYKFFNPDAVEGESPFTDEILNMSLKEYENYVKTPWHSCVRNTEGYTNPKIKLKHFIVGTAFKEANTQGGIGKALVVVVTYNRAAFYDYNLTKVYVPLQQEFLGFLQINGSEADNNYFGGNYKKYAWDLDESYDTPKPEYQLVLDVMKKSPSVLIGEVTEVSHPVNIYYESNDTGQETKSMVLSYNEVSKIDSYCTTPGYSTDEAYRSRVNVKEDGKLWRSEHYVSHHLGHVFTCGFMKKYDNYWEQAKPKVSNGKKDLKELSSSLFDSIQKSLNYTNNFSTSSLKMIYDKDGIFYIISNDGKKEVLQTTFDIILNTYFDYFSMLSWGVNTNTQVSPQVLRVKYSKDNTINKIIGLYSVEESNGTFVFTNYDSTLAKFDGYNKILKKKILNMSSKTDEELASMFIGETAESIKKIKNDDSIDIESCSSVSNAVPTNYSFGNFTGFVEGKYTWNGCVNETNCGLNKAQLSPKDENIFIGHKGDLHKAYTFLIHEGLKGDKGSCAKQIRQAIESMLPPNHHSLVSRPYSACVYARFMEYWGWEKYYESRAPITSGYIPQDGDIAISAGLLNGKRGSKDLHGHIQMYISSSSALGGNQPGWYSYKRINDPWCYPDNGRPFVIFRLRS